MYKIRQLVKVLAIAGVAPAAYCEASVQAPVHCVSQSHRCKCVQAVAVGVFVSHQQVRRFLSDDRVLFLGKSTGLGIGGDFGTANNDFVGRGAHDADPWAVALLVVSASRRFCQSKAAAAEM